MEHIFLERELRILKNKCGKTKGEILRFIDIVNYLAVKRELSFEIAERYTYICFKMLEGARES